MAQATKTIRSYGKEFTVGDILYSPQTKKVFFYINSGFMGKKRIDLVKNSEGTYDMLGSYVKDGQTMFYKMGKTFEVKNNQQIVMEHLTKGTLGMGTKFDTTLEKDVVSTDNALYITTHKLKEPQILRDNLTKLGWVTGQYGIEIEAKVEHPQSQAEKPSITPEVSEETVQDEDEIPF